MKKIFLPILSFLLLLLIINACKRDSFTTRDDRRKLADLLAVTNGEQKIPDFSFAGYERNEKAIPQANVLITVQPGDGDDGERIQAAIDQVATAPLIDGIRGAVLLKAGTYEVAKAINITANGVVLRGEGQSENGTILVSTSKASRFRAFSFINVNGTGEGFQELSAHQSIVSDTIAVGTKRITVASASGYKAGDTIIVAKTPNQQWIDTIGMSQYGWTPEAYKIPNIRVVEKVENNTIWVDIPIVDAIYKRFGGGYVAKASAQGRISQCGIENILLKSSYASEEDESHAWTAITFSRVTNSWVKNVTAKYFAFSCVKITGQSDFNTIQDCAMLDPKSLPIGDRRYAFFIESGMGNLFQRCFTRLGRHDFVTGARVTGPNVFLDCLATQTISDIGPHHRWATGLLLDNISGGVLYALNRKEAGTGHGWTGAQIMYWNSIATMELAIDNPPTAVNWAIGCKVGTLNGKGEYISVGKPVDPRSLFLSQLERRLGSEAVIRITTPEQRQGTMLKTLTSWQGN